MKQLHQDNYIITHKLKELKNEFRYIKELGFGTWARLINKDEFEARIDYLNNLNELIEKRNKKGISLDINWSLYDSTSNKDWIPQIQHNYDEPEIIREYSHMLHMFFIEMAFIGIEELDFEIELNKINDLILSYIEEMKERTVEVVNKTIDPHACVHILETFTTFNMTLLQFLEAYMDYPEKMEFETRPEVVEFYCHPALGGLTVSEYLFNMEEKKRASQKPRSPSNKTNRVGQNISFEELSNIYRTSRVTLANMYNKTLLLFRKKLIAAGIHDHRSL